MNVNIQFGRTNQGQAPVMAAHLQLPPLTFDVVKLLRQIKSEFPKEYADVGRELILPDHLRRDMPPPNGAAE